ncbi:hypothetical protein CYLTODRAFT_425676 [Cylindrobasidium torrendii FP15055 ss-10]|uniref:F-box domain-containing protein n=1 Tax=Cylindrobasidium torrendii FP15055 ss-10 TaxID=1314674 RepID=A0A0D7B325_9AGAR|nr:hypothetical protein CYLTODRAFT_425676 [Cylindrobasidium torrendii FP15055 ss-10]
MSQTSCHSAHTQVCPRCASPHTTYPDWQSVVQNEQIRTFLENPWLHDFGATHSPTANAFRDYASSLNLDDQVETLERSIAQLTFQQKLLATLSQTLKAFFAPIHTLPADVLVNIFGLCASANAKIDRVHPIHEPSTAFLLSQVCRRWRNLVIDSPLLWSRFPSDWLQFGSRTLAAIAFERSRQVPLYIQFDFSVSVVPQRMREELRKSSYRWRWLDGYHGVGYEWWLASVRGTSYQTGAKLSTKGCRSARARPRLPEVDKVILNQRIQIRIRLQRQFFRS